MAGRAHHRRYEPPSTHDPERSASDEAYAEALKRREERRAEALRQAVENRPPYFWEKT